MWDGGARGSGRDRRRPMRGGLSLAFPPLLRHDRSRMGAKIRQARRDERQHIS
jgi:hypothetical protein